MRILSPTLQSREGPANGDPGASPRRSTVSATGSTGNATRAPAAPASRPAIRGRGERPVPFRCEIDPRLVEETVLLATESTPAADRERFRSERDRIYLIADPDEREAEFRGLHERWFSQLELGEVVERELRKRPEISSAVSRFLVGYGRSRREEYAELFMEEKEDRGDRHLISETRCLSPVVLLRLRPQTLLGGPALAELLRRELLCVADLLDPEFAFSPRIDLPEDLKPFESLIRRRYKVLWDATIDGRLAADGDRAAERRESSREEFLTAFTPLGAAAGRWFDRFFDGPRPSHPELVRFATDPGPLDRAEA